jgi:hypothetical protein
MARIKKAQKGKQIQKMNRMDMNRKDSVPSEMFPGKMIPRSSSNYENGSYAEMFKSKSAASKKVAKPAAAPAKKVVPKTKMKSGGKAFPDLTGDGKVTRADILKGRGVIKKSGGKMKTCKSGC